MQKGFRSELIAAFVPPSTSSLNPLSIISKIEFLTRGGQFDKKSLSRTCKWSQAFPVGCLNPKEQTQSPEARLSAHHPLCVSNQGAKVFAIPTPVALTRTPSGLTMTFALTIERESKRETLWRSRQRFWRRRIQLLRTSPSGTCKKRSSKVH
jgi:hypothetical protein